MENPDAACLRGRLIKVDLWEIRECKDCLRGWGGGGGAKAERPLRMENTAASKGQEGRRWRLGCRKQD